MNYVTIITEKRINQMMNDNLTLNGSDYGQILNRLLNGLKKWSDWNDTISKAKESHIGIVNELQVNTRDMYERYRNTLSGWSINYSSMISSVECWDLHYVNIHDFNALVKTVYDKWKPFYDFCKAHKRNPKYVDTLSEDGYRQWFEREQKKQRMEQEEDKAGFIQAMGKALCSYAYRTNVSEIEYAQTGSEEFAVVTFHNGNQKSICITGDSCLAIMNDVYRKLC